MIPCPDDAADGGGCVTRARNILCPRGRHCFRCASLAIKPRNNHHPGRFDVWDRRSVADPDAIPRAVHYPPAMRFTVPAFVLLLSLPAVAHIQLDVPLVRYVNTPRELNKQCPCGGTTGGTSSCGGTVLSDPNRSATRVTTYAPGETITVEWRETIGHTGRYRIAFDAAIQHLRRPDVLVYLRCPVRTLTRRIERRGRAMEKSIPPAYLRSLHALYEQWFEAWDQSPKIVLETDRLDPVTDLLAHSEVLDIMGQYLARRSAPGDR
jgi:hypothetical protein